MAASVGPSGFLTLSGWAENDDASVAGAASSLPRRIEISKIGRPLPLLRGHDQSVSADEIRLSLNSNMIVVLHAVVLDPPRMRIGLAAIALGYGPRARQC